MGRRQDLSMTLEYKEIKMAKNYWSKTKPDNTSCNARDTTLKSQPEDALKHRVNSHHMPPLHHSTSKHVTAVLASTHRLHHNSLSQWYTSRARHSSKTSSESTSSFWRWALIRDNCHNKGSHRRLSMITHQIYSQEIANQQDQFSTRIKPHQAISFQEQEHEIMHPWWQWIARPTRFEWTRTWISQKDITEERVMRKSVDS